jgi:hypothetical protein
MTPRVREILSWYGADSAGTLTNLAQLLNHGRLGGTGKVVILPVDQGFEHGPARSFAPNPQRTIRFITLSSRSRRAAMRMPLRGASWRQAPATSRGKFRLF